jgi:hypothetical protein
MEKFMDTEDWMDCKYILAEELDKRGFCFEAFKLLADILVEERRRPYYKHFTEDIEIYLKTLVRQRLKSQVDEETWIDCLEIMIRLGFPPRDELRFRRSMSDTLEKMRA